MPSFKTSSLRRQSSALDEEEEDGQHYTSSDLLRPSTDATECEDGMDPLESLAASVQDGSVHDRPLLRFLSLARGRRGFGDCKDALRTQNETMGVLVALILTVAVGEIGGVPRECWDQPTIACQFKESAACICAWLCMGTLCVCILNVSFAGQVHAEGLAYHLSHFIVLFDGIPVVGCAASITALGATLLLRLLAQNRGMSASFGIFVAVGVPMVVGVLVLWYYLERLTTRIALEGARMSPSRMSKVSTSI